MITIAKTIKAELSGIAGIETIAIGLEPSLSPKDYPIIRIVPLDSRPDNVLSGSERIGFDIYIGVADKNSLDNYEALHEQLDWWESEIKTRLNTSIYAAFLWKSTKHDEDKLPNVKLIAMKFDAVG